MLIAVSRADTLAGVTRAAHLLTTDRADDGSVI